MIEPAFISQLLLWIAIVALGVLVMALARQVGILHERIAPAGALALGRQISVGETGPHMTLRSVDGADVEIGGPRKRSQLLFFVSPDCPICKSLLPVVRSAALAEQRWLDVILASDGDGPAHRRMIEELGLSDLPYLLSEALGRQLGVSKLPYGVLLDESGKIAAFGLVASIQQFLERRQAGGSHP